MLKKLINCFFKAKQPLLPHTTTIDEIPKDIKNKMKLWNETEPICPSCSTPFIAWPERKRKCPSCKEDVYVKKSPKTQKWSLIDKNTMQTWEIEWEKIYFIKRWLTKLSEFGYTKSDYEKIITQSQMSEKDAIWSIFNQALLKYAGDFHTSGMIYFNMAYFLLEEGKDPIHIVQLCKEMEIQDIEKQIKNSRSLSSNIKISSNFHISANCTNCKFLNDKVISIEEARRLQPIPLKDCNRQFCLASYRAFIEN